MAIVVFSGVEFVSAMDPFGCGLWPSSPKASLRSVALIDSLSTDYPNPSFTESVSYLSKTAGYSFDYFPPEKSTIDTLIHLTERRYSIIIFRTHGTQNLPVLVTSDPYNQDQRTWDQLNGRLQPVQVEENVMFGVNGSFIRNTMCGRFSGTLVLASGCVTMSGDLGSSFVSKGAGAFIGWTGMVTLEHTDSVFVELVGLLLSGISARDAVGTVMGIDGLDVATGATLGVVSVTG